MLNAEGQYVLFVCEGVAEQYILTTLIERGELTVPNELIRLRRNTPCFSYGDIRRLCLT